MPRHWTAAALGGLQEKLDQRLVSPPEWLALRDVDLNTRGAFAVRTGYEELPLDILDGGTLPIEAKESIFWRDEELLAVWDRTLYAWVPQARAWKDKGPWFRGDLRVVPLVDTAQDQTEPDAAQVDGMQIVTWEESTGLYYSVVVDPVEAKSVIVPPTLLEAAWSKPRTIALADRVLVFAVDAAGGLLRCAVWRPTAPTAALNFAPVSTIDQITPAYDVRQDGSGAVLVALDGPQLALRRLDSGGAVTRATAYTPSTTPAVCVAIAPGGADLNDEILIAWGDTNIVTAAWIDSDLALSRAEQTLALAGNAARLSATRGTSVGVVGVFVAAEFTAAAQFQDSVRFGFSAHDGGAAHTLTLIRTQRGARIAAHMVGFENRALAPLVYPGVVTGSTGAVVILQDVASLAIVARAYDLGRAVSRTSSNLASSQASPDIRVTLPYRTRFKVNPADTTYFAQTAIGQMALDLTPRALAAAQLGGSVYAAMGGYLACYDGGARAFEQGYHVVPEIISTSTAGPGLVPAGTYNVAVIYAWVDERDRLHVSAPAVASVVVAGPNTIAVNVTTCRFTARTSPRNQIQIWAYLSVAGAGQGEPLYLVTDLANPTLSNPVTGSSTVTVSISVDAAAPEFVARERLYTQGGVIPFDPTPGTRFVAVAGDRLYFGDPERPYLVRASNILTEGFAVSTNPITGLEAPVETTVTAFGEQDGVFAMFSARQPYVFGGDGPAPTAGGSAGWSDPRKVPADSGATSQETLAEVPEGIVYSGERGPRLFSRGQVVSAFYEPVERRFLRFGQTVAAATYRPDIGDLFLAAEDNEITELRRRSVRYNVTTQRWCDDSWHNGPDASVSAGGSFALLRYDGRVCLSNTGYTTGRIPVQPRMCTPWARVDDTLDPRQKVLIVTVIGQYLDAHRLRLAFAYDYEERYVDARTVDPEAVRANLPLFGVDSAVHGTWGFKTGWGEAGNTEGDSGQPWPYQAYQWRYRIDRACEAVSAEVTILQNVTATAAAEIAAVQIDVDWYLAPDDRHQLPPELEFPASPIP